MLARPQSSTRIFVLASAVKLGVARRAPSIAIPTRDPTASCNVECQPCMLEHLPFLLRLSVLPSSEVLNEAN